MRGGGGEGESTHLLFPFTCQSTYTIVHRGPFIDLNSADEVIMGNVLSANLGQAPARQAALKAGLPVSTVCTTVNKVCASGLKAVMLGAQSVALGSSTTVVAGGMESMSQAPYYVPNLRTGQGYGHVMALDAIVADGLTCSRYRIHMGECSEGVAKRLGIGREEQDEYAQRSYERAAAAVQSGRFQTEIETVTVEGKKGATTAVNEDEEWRKVDFSRIASLKPAFVPEGGTITAANASTLNDGASAVILTSIKHQGDTAPLARILSMADAECDPREFAVAPALAIPRALERASLQVGDIDLWEINEAFSVVALANIKLLGLDAARVNVLGGAVSLGHPIGSSGCRLLVTLVHQLQPGQRGCVAICNGGGGASAMIIERL